MFIPNQPVSFVPVPYCGDCETKNYCQPIHPADITRFLLPNKCVPSVSLSPVIDYDFTVGGVDISSWTQLDTNGGTNDWSITGTPQRLKAVSLSKIFSQSVDIIADIAYHASMVFTVGAGCTIVIVGFKGDGSYDILGEMSSSGTVDFTSSTGYTIIGFYTTGSCGETLTAVESFTLTKDEYTSCTMGITVVDKDDIVVGSGTPTFYDSFVAVEVDWSNITLEQGNCYRICIDGSHFYGDNLFIDGDNGSFETSLDGILSDDVSAALSTTKVYEGSKSFKVTLTAPPLTVLQSQTILRLQPNTNYTIEAWVYGDAVGADCYFKLSWIPSSGANQSATLDFADAAQQWHKISLNFTTGSTGGACKGVFQLEILTNTPWGFVDSIPIYTDAISLYETDSYSQCSEPFCLDEKCSVLLTYSNNEPGFGFIYPDGFEFNLRIAGGISKPKYPQEEESYEYSDGEKKVLYASSRKISILSIEDAPEYIHDAIRLALLHDNLSINGKGYTYEGGEYSPIWRNKTNVASSQVEVASSVQDTRNNYL